VVLLLAQAAAEAFLALAAGVLIRGIGPEDIPLTFSEHLARSEKVGATTAVLVVLAAASLVSGFQRLHGREGGRTLLVTAHLTGGGAVLLFGAPGLCAGLAALGLFWALALRPDSSPAPAPEEA
jgi:hypothetical protein